MSSSSEGSYGAPPSGFWLRGEGSAVNNEPKLTASSIQDEFYFPVKRKRYFEKQLRDLRDTENEKRAEELRLIDEEGKRIRNAELKHPISACNWHNQSESPNSLKNILNPTVGLACNFVSSTPKVKPRNLHAKDWDDRVILPSPARRLLTNNKQRIRKKKKKRKMPSILPPSPKRIPKQAALSKPSDILGYNEANDSHCLVLPGVGYEVTKSVMIREELLSYMQKVSGKVDDFEFLDLLEELRKVGVRLIENLVRLQRIELKRQKEEYLKRKSKSKKTPLQCDRAHVCTWNHDHQPLNYNWNGCNYLLKMCSDMDVLEEAFQRIHVQRGIDTLTRNPFLLDLNLDELNQKVESLNCPESELWTLVDKNADIRSYRAALVLVREEKFFDKQRLQQESSAPATTPVPETKQDILKSCIETAQSTRQVNGCWQNSRVQLPRLPPTPYILKQARLTFNERIRVINEQLEREKREHRFMCEKSAVTLQRALRKHCRRAKMRLHRRRVNCCIQFQAIVRGMLARRRVEPLLDNARSRVVETELKKWLALAEQSALVVQCFWRQILANKTVLTKRRNMAATRMSTWYRGVCSKHIFFMHLCARRVQNAIRVKKAKNIAKILRMDKRQRVAAVAMQGMFRKARAKSIVEHERQNGAIIKVQRRLRGALARRIFRQALCARKLQSIWRGVKDRKAAARRRSFIGAIKKVQKWQKFNFIVQDTIVKSKFLKWKDHHVTSKRKFQPGSDSTLDYYHLCALYDHKRRLVDRRQLLVRTSSSKRVLRIIESILEKERALRGDTQPIRRAPLLGTFVVRARYARRIKLTKHLSASEVEAELGIVNEKLSTVQEKIEIAEGLAKERFKARRYAKKVDKVFRKESVVDDVLSFDKFTNKLKKNESRREKATKVDDRMQTASKRSALSLLIPEWTHRGQVELLREADAQLKIDLRQSQARLCSMQIANFIKDKAYHTALERRYNNKLDEIYELRKAKDWSSMQAEDIYAEHHREYLAVDVEKLKEINTVFNKYCKTGQTDISRSEVQQVAFELGITVPMSKVNEFMKQIDMNGNNRIDFQEFAMWFQVKGYKDRALLQLELNKRAAKQAIMVGGLKAKLYTKRTVKHMLNQSSSKKCDSEAELTRNTKKKKRRGFFNFLFGRK